MSATVTLPDIDVSGLTDAQVSALEEQGETNAVKSSSSRSLADIIRANVFTLFNGIIVTAMILVLIAGSWKDAVFGVVIIINTGIGIVTELRAKHTLDKLSILVASDYTVRRNGKNVAVSHNDIVLGDKLWLRAGEQVPADGVVEQNWGIELDESMLTGESRTVRKQPGDTVYSGSTVISGLALVTVSAVGAHSYAAKLTAQAKVYKKTISELSRGVNAILKFMTALVVPLCILLVITQIRTVGGWYVAVTTGSWREAVVSSVAGVVGMIPEGLVLLTSLNFALAAVRLAREKTLVQELESVETLARVDSLNLDKTGTITDGTIMFEQLIPLIDAASLPSIQQALYDLCNEPQPNMTGEAILKAFNEQGLHAGNVGVRVAFSSGRKWSAIAHDTSIASDERLTDAANGRWYLGAPEVLLSAMAKTDESVLKRVEAEAAHGNRVLLVAYAAGDVPADFETASALDPQLQPVALVLCAEHIRDDARATLQWFREQGVRCRIISGDNPVTVGAIANKVALCGDRDVVAMDARTLPSDVHELANVIENVDVLGRVLPEQKKAIVQALHERDHVVAMTGDGVNDTLALKQADLGIAMGNAAPAAKAVAQLILIDSKFSHLPDVVARGRQVMANMERVASLFLTKTVYSALISFGVILMQIPFPYLPRHISYIGAFTIGMPAFLLALAPNTRRYMPGFLQRVFTFAVPFGIATALAVLMTARLIPLWLQWNLDASDLELGEIRSICAATLFAMGILVLASVARPLHSWRAFLVAGFAVGGVIGMCIPFVVNFFAFALPTGMPLIYAGMMLIFAVVLFAVAQRSAPHLMPKAIRTFIRIRTRLTRGHSDFTHTDTIPTDAAAPDSNPNSDLVDK